MGNLTLDILTDSNNVENNIISDIEFLINRHIILGVHRRNEG